jgi:mono/diheme cytochrome c family protein
MSRACLCRKSTQAGSLFGNWTVPEHLLVALLIAVPLLAAFLSAGCQQPKPLPEQGTYAQQLYVERCGACHRPYRPSSMTAAMWEAQIEAMDAKIMQAGQPPLSPEQHLTILDYLKRNAGRQ